MLKRSFSFRVLLCFLLSLTAASPTFGNPADSLLIELNRAIQEKEKYVTEKRERISGYHSNLKNFSAGDHSLRFRVLQALASEYKTFIYDSAFSTVRQMQAEAYRLNDPVKIAYGKVQLGLVLLSSGMFKEALDSLLSINLKDVPDSIKVEYYFTLGRTYYDLGDFDKDKFYTPRYTALGSAYLDSAQQLTRKTEYLYTYISGLRNLKNQNNREALSDLNSLLTHWKLTNRQIAITASTLSHYYITRNEYAEAIDLLARAAIADIRSATKETAAIMWLAELLYKRGDVKNAYTLIQQAMDDAQFYGARQRMAQVSSIIPFIASAKVNNVEEQRRIALIYATLITILTVLVVVFAISTVKQLKKRKIAERALQESNRIKEEYIGYYFNNNSEYLSKIEALKKSIEMKLMTKKVDDIKFVVGNINLKKERDELYHSFDKVFLKLFPNFVSVFNSYFKEDDRIVLKEGQLMNTELRIFALMRLGIHDPEKIAKILDYSINTIYNYKARVKGKSLLANEEFEKRIMDINAL